MICPILQGSEHVDLGICKVGIMAAVTSVILLGDTLVSQMVSEADSELDTVVLVEEVPKVNKNNKYFFHR